MPRDRYSPTLTAADREGRCGPKRRPVRRKHPRRPPGGVNTTLGGSVRAAHGRVGCPSDRSALSPCGSTDAAPLKSQRTECRIFPMEPRYLWVCSGQRLQPDLQSGAAVGSGRSGLGPGPRWAVVDRRARGCRSCCCAWSWQRSPVQRRQSHRCRTGDDVACLLLAAVFECGNHRGPCRAGLVQLGKVDDPADVTGRAVGQIF